MNTLSEEKALKGLRALFPVRDVESIENSQVTLSRFCNTSLVESDEMEVSEMHNYLVKLMNQIEEESSGK